MSQTRRRSTTAQARLQARVSQETLRELQYAAELRGVTLSEFVISTAQVAARRVIEECHVTMVSAASWQAITDALDNPPPPNEALRRAMAQHRSLTAEQ